MKTATIILVLGILTFAQGSAVSTFEEVTPVMKEFLHDAYKAYNYAFLSRRGLETDWEKFLYGF